MTDAHVTITSPDEATTRLFGIALAASAENGTVFALAGELGTGKTQLAKAIAAGLGITEPVTSPTFALVMEYARPGGDWFYHLDMYRIENASQALAFGVEEYLFRKDAVAVVEWPERIVELLEPDKTGRLVRIDIAHAGAHSRTLTVPRDIAGRLQDHQTATNAADTA